MAKVKTQTIRFILENGDNIEVTYPIEIADDLFDEMREAQSMDAFWYVGNYRDAVAMYKGNLIDHINMKRVIGMV